MSKFFKISALAIFGFLFFLSGCGVEDNKEDIGPNAPIITSVVMPSESNAMPGTDITIRGVGFSHGDIIECIGDEGQSSFTPTVVSVSNSGIVISIPETACGYYIVTVTRNGKSTTLQEKLYIPKTQKIDNVVMPQGVIKWGETLVITADGLNSTDEVYLESEAYGEVKIDGAVQAGKISFVVPSTLYGVNNVKLSREGTISVLGTVTIGAVLFQKALGGIVYYISDDGTHGLVVYPEVMATETAWGPSIPRDEYAAGTDDGIYHGKVNTEKLVAQYNKVVDGGTYKYDAPSPAVLCDNLEASGYDDWFLPSIAELSELFKVKSSVADEGGFTIPGNNYWTSVEIGEGAWIWAMGYVNFYEETQLVTAWADVVAWRIGTLAVREF